eukprot:9518717-Alexandrium_andersonii.AAC.1
MANADVPCPSCPSLCPSHGAQPRHSSHVMRANGAVAFFARLGLHAQSPMGGQPVCAATRRTRSLIRCCGCHSQGRLRSKKGG